MRTAAVALAALTVFAAAPSVRAADFGDIGGLAQGEFRDLARDLGAAFSYKGVTPATPLGTLGFDLGIELTQTQLEHSRLFALAGADDHSSLLIPKVHIHKGLPANFDISAFIGGATQVDAYVWGAAVRWTFVDDGLVYPAVGVRGSYTNTTGTGDLKVATGAIDLLVSKRFTAVTPYIGAGMVRTEASVANSLLSKEKIDEGRFFAGLNVNLVALNLAFEAEKLGDNVSLSAKLGWRF